MSNTIVATAAHVICSDNWDGLGWTQGWADEVYMVQAYDPSSTNKEPYGRVYADNGNMVKGANWMKNNKFPDDSDWGVFPIRGTLKGNYSCLPRKMITPKTFISQNITTYGYPGSGLPMYFAKGVTTMKPSAYSTYRVLYSTDRKGGDADCWHGVSGGPVLDGSGNVIGIFSGDTSMHPSVVPLRARALGMDVDLYNFLSRYK